MRSHSFLAVLLLLAAPMLAAPMGPESLKLNQNQEQAVTKKLTYAQSLTKAHEEWADKVSRSTSKSDFNEAVDNLGKAMDGLREPRKPFLDIYLSFPG